MVKNKRSNDEINSKKDSIHETYIEDIWGWSEFPPKVLTDLFKLHKEECQTSLTASSLSMLDLVDILGEWRTKKIKTTITKPFTSDPAFIVMCSLRLISNRDSFLNWLRESPWLIVTDVITQFAIQLLRFYCRAGRQEKAQYARNLLNDAGLSLLIPKGIPRNRTKDYWLNMLQLWPRHLIKTVEDYEAELLNLFASCKEKHGHRSTRVLNPRRGEIVYECCISHALEWLESKTDKQVSVEDFLNMNIEKGIDITIVALRFISYISDTPFPSLLKHYYRISNRKSHPVTVTK